MKIDWLRIVLMTPIALGLFYFGINLVPKFVSLDIGLKLYLAMMVTYLISITQVFGKLYGFAQKITR